MAGTSRSTDRIVNILVCAGASVVIFGAWAKILHLPFADTMLTVGLLTEAAIFLLYAFLPPPGQEMAKLAEALPKMMGGSQGNPALQSMDKMLQEADITPANLKRLGDNFTKLGATVSNIGEVGDVVKSTSDFSAKTKEATTAMASLTTAYTTSANTMGVFNNAADSAKGFHDQVQVLTKNLSSLNTIYELELNESNNHLKALNSFYGKMAEASQVMVASVDDANRAKEQIGTLANNLGKLNSVYGNMITAMQGGRA